MNHSLFHLATGQAESQDPWASCYITMHHILRKVMRPDTKFTHDVIPKQVVPISSAQINLKANCVLILAAFPVRNTGYGDN